MFSNMSVAILRRELMSWSAGRWLLQLFLVKVICKREKMATRTNIFCKSSKSVKRKNCYGPTPLLVLSSPCEPRRRQSSLKSQGQTTPCLWSISPFYLLYWKEIHLWYISRQTRDVYDSYCWPHVTKVEGRHYSTVILDFPCLFEHFLRNPCMCHELWAPDLSSYITWNPKLFHTNANEYFKLWNLRITTRK